MTAQSATRAIAGFFILLSLGLGHMYEQFNVMTLSWLWFVAFVGANLLQSGFTRWCLMTNILKKVGLS